MTATDELRALLDERGVEWEDHSDESLRHTVWNGAECWFTEFPDGWTAMGISKRCTPAQAIAATLGRGTCKVDGTIKWDWDRCEPYWRHELSCGHTATTLEPEPPRFCAECGSRVIGERYE